MQNDAKQKELVENWYKLAENTFEKRKIWYRNTTNTNPEKLTSSLELTALLDTDMDYLRDFLKSKGFPDECLTIFSEEDCIVIKISLL